jgi:hypothetical protein
MGDVMKSKVSLGSVFFILIGSAFSFASEVEVPQYYERLVLGFKSREAVRLTLQPENLERVFHAFYLGNGSINWDLQEVTRKENSIHFRMSLKSESFNGGASATNSGSGWYGYFSGALSYAGAYVSHWVTGDLQGELTQKKTECPEPFEKIGYELEFDFKDSSYVIYSLLEKMKVTVCLKENLSRDSTVARFHTRVTPGSHFPGFENPIAQKVLDAHEEAWASAFFEVASRIDVELVHLDN